MLARVVCGPHYDMGQKSKCLNLQRDIGCNKVECNDSDNDAVNAISNMQVDVDLLGQQGMDFFLSSFQNLTLDLPQPEHSKLTETGLK